MATGPFYPFSAHPVTEGKVFPWLYKDSTSRIMQGLGVMASLDGDAIWRLLWKCPDPIPSGTLKLRSNVVSVGAGNVKYDPKWTAFGSTTQLDNRTPSSEGTQTITTVANQFQVADLTLDAATAPTAGQWVYMDLTMITTSWTLASVLVWIPELWWI
jgi:hypothetical protein